jgi:hypothetical protein
MDVLSMAEHVMKLLNNVKDVREVWKFLPAGIAQHVRSPVSNGKMENVIWLLM